MWCGVHLADIWLRETQVRETRSNTKEKRAEEEDMSHQSASFPLVSFLTFPFIWSSPWRTRLSSSDSLQKNSFLKLLLHFGEEKRRRWKSGERITNWHHIPSLKDGTVYLKINKTKRRHHLFSSAPDWSLLFRSAAPFHFGLSEEISSSPFLSFIPHL